MPFLDMPAEIRRVVYSTNAIESINYQLRKVSKTRGQFPGACPKPSRNQYARCHLNSELDTLNGYVKSIHSRQSEEFLNINTFTTALPTRVDITDWHYEYNHVRRHSSLSYKTPHRIR